MTWRISPTVTDLVTGNRSPWSPLFGCSLVSHKRHYRHLIAKIDQLLCVEIHAYVLTYLVSRVLYFFAFSSRIYRLRDANYGGWKKPKGNG